MSEKGFGRRLRRIIAVSRVWRMERCFDRLQKAAQKAPEELRNNPAAKWQLRRLTRYYEGGRWLRDYRLDEQGFFPRELKRGVLSQDAVFNFLGEIKED